MPKRTWRLIGFLMVVVLVIFSLGGSASGEDGIQSKPGGLPAGAEHGDLSDLARHLNNPVGPVWNIVTQNNWYFQKGFPSTAYRVQYVMNFQPVLPIPLTRDLSLVMRPVVPLLSAPFASGMSVHPLGVEWGRTAGLGDITLEPFLVPNWKPWLIFGVAPTLIVPTATDTHLGQGKVQLGPAVVLGFLTKNWIGGVFVQNWWSVAGSNSKPAVNQMNLQYFLYRMLPDAWQVGFAPNVLVNWRADGKNMVTFPLGLGVGKTFQLGALPPIQTSLEFQWMAVHPDEFGQRFNLRFVFKPVLPSMVKQPIFD